MDFDDVRRLIEQDFAATDALILQSLHSDVALIDQIGHYIVGNGGKRLRPMIVLLAARALGYEGNQHVNLAAIIEFIHTATLLHDDVVDGSDMRRSQETANAVWGNAASVLVGDFLYSRAFEMMVTVQNMTVMDILSHATNRIAEGEVLQLLNCNDPDTDENRYREVIDRKTATLFAAGARLGGEICNASGSICDALSDYGRHLGMAFQMVDDALDYGSSDEDIGKNLGDDLAEGKPTLPLIHALELGNDKQKSLIKSVIEQGDTSRIDDILKIIEATDAITYTARLAQDEALMAKQALSTLPASEFREALETLADFSVQRSL
ncbi:MAG: polyprenyl synthetase family protein [bacterium]